MAQLQTKPGLSSFKTDFWTIWTFKIWRVIEIHIWLQFYNEQTVVHYTEFVLQWYNAQFSMMCYTACVLCWWNVWRKVMIHSFNVKININPNHIWRKITIAGYSERKQTVPKSLGPELASPMFQVCSYKFSAFPRSPFLL